MIPQIEGLMISIANLKAFRLKSRNIKQHEAVTMTDISPINKSGLHPVEYKVLVLQDTVENISEGGIVMPRETTEKEQWAETDAILIAIGGNAFKDWDGDIPVVGDRIVVRQYAGYKKKGKDGVEYQVCNDKDITLIIRN